jgi:hypothetical protein
MYLQWYLAQILRWQICSCPWWQLLKADYPTTVCEPIVYKIWEPPCLITCGPPWPVTMIALSKEVLFMIHLLPPTLIPVCTEHKKSLLDLRVNMSIYFSDSIPSRSNLWDWYDSRSSAHEALVCAVQNRLGPWHKAWGISHISLTAATWQHCLFFSSHTDWVAAN